MLVKDYMTRNLVVIDREETVRNAKDILEQKKFRHLPVVDDGKIVGVVSNRDINRSLAISESVMSICGVEPERELRVEQIMTDEFMSIEQDERLKRAAEIMMEKKIGCLPVMQNGDLVGIITETDIMRVFVEVIGQEG